MFAQRYRAAATGIALGYAADLMFADPRRGHPVAAFGTGAATLERATYRDSRWAGAVHTAIALGLLTVGGVAVGGLRGPAATVAMAAATWTALGGTSLARTGEQMADLLERDDLDGARALLPSLCGRDPAALDGPGMTRAALESIAENTSDAQVAPLLWAAIAGVPGVLVYRGANTLDAMIGHRSPRYARFGWAAARFDDVLNYVPARVSGLLTAVAAPVVGGRASDVLRTWRRDAARHPSPNAGVVEASFAAALGVSLGGPTQYHHELQIRPTLGSGRTPTVGDLRAAVKLSRWVQAGALGVAVGAVGLRACGRSGRRASVRS